MHRIQLYDRRHRNTLHLVKHHVTKTGTHTQMVLDSPGLTALRPSLRKHERQKYQSQVISAWRLERSDQ